jgi:Bacterial Ig-like domain (group 3)
MVGGRSRVTWLPAPVRRGSSRQSAWDDLVERDRRRCARLSGSARRVLFLVVLCTGSTWWLAAGLARADTPPSNNGLPTISGIVQQGQVLTASPGTWSGDDPISFSYQWSDGQTGSTATVSAADVGQSLTVTVTASNAFGQDAATSGSVGPVLPAAPVNSVKPGITGTAQQGATLSVSNGTWSNNPTAFAYVWQDCDSSGSTCSPITGATSSSYIVQASDVGSKVLAVVTASNAGGQNSATSGGVGPVLPAAPVATTAPAISGTAQQGKTLIVSNGVWSNNPTAFTYVWQDCNSSDTACSTIAGATSNTYTLRASDVGQNVSVTVTASNSGGHTSVTTASVGPVLPPAPVNTQAPVISGTAEQGNTLSVSNGTWSNDPTGYTYAWESCSSSGTNCAAIGGATSSRYALSEADVGRTIACVVTANGAGGSTSATTTNTGVVVASPIAVASQTTSTDLLATPSAPVTNQSVTLIATVSAGTSSTALWGAVTFQNGGAAIVGCANMPAAPSGTSATVACVTSFAASTAQLSAVFTPTPGSILKGSSSPGERLAIAPDATSTSLNASASVNLGASTTYTATVAPPAARPGPVVPTGWVEFLDGGQPIGRCASQPLVSGAATCAVSYAAAGAHQITARYSGDANFTGSSSPAAHVSAVPVPTSVLGTIASTMQWNFYYTPNYTLVRSLVVNAALPGSTVVVRCLGRGCPFAQHATVLASSARCARRARTCVTSGRFNLTPGFAGRRLAIGARITINIVRPNWVGKSYRFTVRSRRGPRVQIGCLAPGRSVPGVGC